MANGKRCEAEFKVGDTTYRLKFDWNAAAEFEDACGLVLSDLMLQALRKRVSAKSVRGMLWAGLRRHHPEVDLAAAGRLIDSLGRAAAVELLSNGLLYYFPELDKEAKDRPRPPEPALPT